jgi:hypothetical protein
MSAEDQPSTPAIFRAYIMAEKPKFCHLAAWFSGAKNFILTSFGKK